MVSPLSLVLDINESKIFVPKIGIYLHIIYIRDTDTETEKENIK